MRSPRFPFLFYHVFLVTCLSFFFLSCCGQNPEKAVVGKWCEIEGMKSLEFFGDGTLHLGNMEGCNKTTLAGDYRLTDNNHINVSLRGEESIPSIVWEMGIDKDALTINEETGESTYTRAFDGDCCDVDVFQLVELSLPTDAEVHKAIALDEGNVFVISDKGLLSTDNNGKLWKRRETAFSVTTTSMLEVVDKSIFLGCKDGLYVSEDHGDTWAELLGEVVQYLAVTTSAMCAVTANRIHHLNLKNMAWTQTDRDELPAKYYSKKEQIKLHIPDVNEFPIDKVSISKQMIYVGASPYRLNAYNGGVLYSADAGKSWKRIIDHDEHVTSIATIGGEHVVVVDGTGGLRSGNQGKTWDKVAFSNGNLTSVLAHGGTLYGATETALFRSEDGGCSWTDVETGIQLQEPEHLSISISNSTLFVYVDKRSTAKWGEPGWGEIKRDRVLFTSLIPNNSTHAN